MPQIDAIIRGKSRAEWIKLLEAAGVLCAPINTFPELANEARTDAVEILQEVPGIGKPCVRLPIEFDGVRSPIRRPAPRIGEHNEEILA